MARQQDPRRSLLSLEDGAQEKSWGLGTADETNRKSKEREIQAGDGGKWQQLTFLSSLLRFPERVKKTQNMQVKHSGNSDNHRYLNSTTLHRNKEKIREVLLSWKGGEGELQQISGRVPYLKTNNNKYTHTVPKTGPAVSRNLYLRCSSAQTQAAELPSRR